MPTLQMVKTNKQNTKKGKRHAQFPPPLCVGECIVFKMPSETQFSDGL